MLLINPPSRGIYYRLGLVLPPLGLAYLAEMVRRRGHEVHLLDLNVEREGLTDLDWSQWDLVGISGDTSRHPEALAIARQAKEAGRTVVMGGYHATFMDEDTLKSGVVDYVVRGEGENVFPDLVDCLAAGENPARVRGLSFLVDGNVFRTPDAEPVRDLDSLPLPARDLLPMHKYRRSHLSGRLLTSMITSRGCPHNCFFCSSSSFAGRRWRARQAKSIVDEIEHLVERYNFKAIAFLDDNFTLSPRRVLEVCQEITRRGLDVFWWCFARVDTIVRNERMVEEMARAGAKMVFLGLESASEAVLQAYKKGFTTDVAAQAVRLLKKHGIRVWGSFILGGLNETREAIRQTVEYARWLNPDIAEFSILTPFPGTELFRRARAENRIATYDWSRYDGGHAVMRTEKLTQRDIALETIRAYVRFYGRLSRVTQILSGLKDFLGARKV
ncbi:MAG: B12-binding domain-containing radical SAM protein [Moorellales bacterium]